MIGNGATLHPSVDMRRVFPGVIRRRRWQLPFQAMFTGAFPDFPGYRFAFATHALDDDVAKDQLGKSEHECTHARPGIELSELQGVVRNASRHAGEIHQSEALRYRARQFIEQVHRKRRGSDNQRAVS